MSGVSTTARHALCRGPDSAGYPHPCRRRRRSPSRRPRPCRRRGGRTACLRRPRKARPAPGRRSDCCCCCCAGSRPARCLRERERGRGRASRARPATGRAVRAGSGGVRARQPRALRRAAAREPERRARPTAARKRRPGGGEAVGVEQLATTCDGSCRRRALRRTRRTIERERGARLDVVG